MFSYCHLVQAFIRRFPFTPPSIINSFLLVCSSLFCVQFAYAKLASPCGACLFSPWYSWLTGAPPQTLRHPSSCQKTREPTNLWTGARIKKIAQTSSVKKGSLQPADFKNFRPKKFIGLQQTMNFYFNLARFSCVMSILILVSILVQCFATDVQVWFVLFTGCASFKMAGKFTLRVDIEYMRKQQTAMCKMWSSRPSNSVKTRWWPRKRVLFGWCQTIIFPLLHCATHLLFGWPSVLIALGMLVLR